MRKNTKKIAVAGGTVIALTAGGVAFAYWSSTGTGTGTGSTTAGASNLTISGNVVPALYPGQAAQNFTANVKNNADNNAYVSGLTAFVTTDKGPACDGSNFSINGSTGAVAASPVALNWTAVDLAKDASQNSANTIQFINKPATNQDGCKSAVITVNYASN